MQDVKDLDFYKIKAKELPKRKFDELIRKAQVKNADYWVQLLNVATLLQQEDKVRIEAQAQKINFIPPKDVNQYLFNDLNFVLWAMPQENPVPSDIYNKMMRLKQLRRDGLSIAPDDKLTGEEIKKLLDAITWERGDEKFGVKVTGSIESGLPFGQDRLLLLWAITEGIKAGTPSVIGFLVRDFLDYFLIDPNGRAYDEVEERCERLKGANIEVWWTTSRGKFKLECNYLDSVLIFRPKKSKVKDKSLDKGSMNMITLHLSLWAHLAKENYVWLHPEVIRDLKDSPGALDLYQWACAYAFKNRIKTIPLIELFSHFGMKEDQPFRDKKKLVKKWIGQVNNAVKNPKLCGVGINFQLELQEGKRGQRNDILVLNPPLEQISNISKA